MSERKNTITAFIPGALDDAGLSKTDFRVWCHIRRREDRGNGCYASSESIAATCKIHRDSVYAAIKRLLARNFISNESRTGQTTIYRTRPIADWLPVGKQGTGEKEGHPLNADTGRRKTRDDHPSENKGHKGNPSEGNPLKASTVPALERELMEKAAEIFGESVMSEHGGLIRNLIREDAATVDSALAETKCLMREGRLTDPKNPFAAFKFNYNDFRRARQKPRTDMGAGTANDGKASQYRGYGKVTPSNERNSRICGGNDNHAVRVIAKQKALKDAEKMDPNKAEVLNATGRSTETPTQPAKAIAESTLVTGTDDISEYMRKLRAAANETP